jgi:hypothetical protein
MKLAHRFVQVFSAVLLAGSAALSGTGAGQPTAELQERSLFGAAHRHLPAQTPSWPQVFAIAGW